MMRKNVFVFMLFLLILGTARMNGQVTIGTMQKPNDGAILDLQSIEKGLLLPRVKITDLNKLYPMLPYGYNQAEHANHIGLMVYNEFGNCPGVYVWTGQEWIKLGQGTACVSSNPAPIVLSAVASAYNICKGSSTTLSATVSNGANIRWYDVPTGGTPLSYSADYQVSPSGTTTYYAEAYDRTTVSATRKDVTVTVNEKPTLTLESYSGQPNQSIIAGNNLTNIIYSFGGGTTMVTVSGLSSANYTIDKPNQKVFIYGNFLTAGVYDYTITANSQGCSDMVSGRITVNPSGGSGTGCTLTIPGVGSEFTDCTGVKWIVLKEENGNKLILTKNVYYEGTSRSYNGYTARYSSSGGFEKYENSTGSLKMHMDTWYGTFVSDELKAKAMYPVLRYESDSPTSNWSASWNKPTAYSSAGTAASGSRGILFPLSISEVSQYIGTSNSARLARDENNVTADWWLRSPGSRATHDDQSWNGPISGVRGYIGNGTSDLGAIVGSGGDYPAGFRPAMWISR